jgi:hypothetical protein
MACVEGVVVAFFIVAWKRLHMLLPRRKQLGNAAGRSSGPAPSLQRLIDPIDP